MGTNKAFENLTVPQISENQADVTGLTDMVRNLAILIAMLAMAVLRPSPAEGTLVTPESESVPKGHAKRAARPKPAS
jgi:hypothetical protein